MKIYSNKRPWGTFRRFTNNELSTIKIITVNPGQELSLQYHKYRSEFWRVLKGRPQITLGNKTINAKEGDEFFIPKRRKHRIAAKRSKVEILEISFGKFSEDDVVRLEDKYGRETIL